MSRGMLTDEVQALANKFLNRDITQAELRLFPYVMTRAIDYTCLDPNHMNIQDRKVWKLWKDEGLVGGGIVKGSLVVTKEWWWIASALVLASYVDAQGNLGGYTIHDQHEEAV